MPHSTHHRARAFAALAAACLFAACVELSSPTEAIESVAPLVAAYPAVVAGDTLRDSLGVARPLEVLAFTGRGDTVRSPANVAFFVADTGSDARIRGAYLVAGSRLGPIQVIGQVDGRLQTLPLTILVVRAPDTASVAGPVGALAYGTRPLVVSAPLQVRVQSRAGGTLADVDGWLVTYRIVREPASSDPANPGVYLVTDPNATKPLRPRDTSIDTTASGLASRAVVVIPALLANRNRADTIVVRATARYKGRDLRGSPIDFTIPLAP